MDVNRRLKKHILALLLFIVIIYISGCTDSINDKNNIDFGDSIITIPNGIELTAKEGSISSESLVLIIKNNSDTYSYNFGNDFGLERYENDDWVAVPYINGGLDVTTTGHILRPNTSSEFTTYFKNAWGYLPVGNYRVVKHFDKTPLNDESKVIAEEIHYYYFEIT